MPKCSCALLRFFFPLFFCVWISVSLFPKRFPPSVPVPLRQSFASPLPLLLCRCPVVSVLERFMLKLMNRAQYLSTAPRRLFQLRKRKTEKPRSCRVIGQHLPCCCWYWWWCCCWYWWWCCCCRQRRFLLSLAEPVAANSWRYFAAYSHQPSETALRVPPCQDPESFALGGLST